MYNTTWRSFVPVLIGQVDLAETNENGNENGRRNGNENERESEKGKDRQPNKRPSELEGRTGSKGRTL